MILTPFASVHNRFQFFSFPSAREMAWPISLAAFMASPARTFSFCLMAADGRGRGHQRNRQRKNRYNHHEHDHRRRPRHRAGRFQNARDDLQRGFDDQRTRHGQRRERPPARRRRTPAPHIHPALQQDEQRLHKKERAPHHGHSPAPQHPSTAYASNKCQMPLTMNAANNARTRPCRANGS